jgi:hypothetical protein
VIIVLAVFSVVTRQHPSAVTVFGGLSKEKPGNKQQKDN